jgi:hypothetical protein
MKIIQRPPSPHLVAILLLTLICVACSPATSTGATPQNHDSPVASASSSGTTLTAVGTSTTQSCPNAVKDPTHWDPIIPTQSGTTQVGMVSCGSLLGDASLQALVNVYHQGTGQILDVYVYTNITAARPSRIFTLMNLEKGDARISASNTIITNEVDENSSINKGRGNAALRRDLSREFQWSSSKKAFVQIAFPGIFPDLTRYHAEMDQLEVNQGYQTWKRDAAMTAQACAENFLKWFPHPVTTIQSGGGAHDINATVLVNNPDPSGSSIIVSLSRLDGNINDGIWEVTDVDSNAATISSLHNGDRLSSPVTITGTGVASGSFIGTMTVFDHLYTDIGDMDVVGDNPTGKTTFSSYLTYTSSYQTGVQEGVLAFYVINFDSNSIETAVMRKVLLSPTTGQ